MTKTSSISDVLRSGAREWNNRRNAGAVAKDHTGATLKQIHSAGADLSELTLVGSEWEDCELVKVSFRDADLSNAYFHGGVLKDCNFNGANLDGATFEKLKLIRCDFSYAHGLDNLELTSVDARDVEGLTEADDRGAAAKDGAGGTRGMSVEELVAWAATEAVVKHGTGATDGEIAEIEAAMGTSFPADYRAFLMQFGQLRVDGVSSYDVFGVPDLEAARQSFRDACDRYVGRPNWRDPSAPTISGPALERKRIELREHLRLPENCVQGIVGDGHDTVRIAYDFMIPIMAHTEEQHQVVQCVGPGSRIYGISMKTWEVEPPRGTFTSWFASRMLLAVRGPR